MKKRKDLGNGQRIVSLGRKRFYNVCYLIISIIAVISWSSSVWCIRALWQAFQASKSSDLGLVAIQMTNDIKRLAVSMIMLTAAFLLLGVVWYREYRYQKKSLVQTAFVDPITGGLNDAAFLKRYQRLAPELKPNTFCVVFLNVRDFKWANAKLGTEAGDRLLAYIYRILDANIRKENQELAARGESDQFFLLLKESHASVIAARLNEMVREMNRFQNTELPPWPLSFRQGACMIETPGTDMLILQDRARMASQAQRRDSPDSCVFYDAQFAEQLRREKELNDLFEESLENHYFQVYLQPKVGLAQDVLEGAEALVRWDYPGRGLIYPSDFIPLFEKNGKICRLDFYVFEEVCRMIQRWQKDGRPLIPVSVNLSRQHFHEKNFLDKFVRTARAYEIPAGAIEFELTESIFFSDQQLAIVKEALNEMHNRGFTCSLDDFGSGFSSLGLLKEFDVDAIKLDRSFFLNMGSEKARDVIACLVDLSKRLKVKTIAEGIETLEQVDYLSGISCDMIQGYYFSRPLPISDFEKWSASKIRK